MKHAENLVATNIAKYTGLRSGTEVKFRAMFGLWHWYKESDSTMSWLWARNRKKKHLIVKYFIAASKPI